MTATSGKIMELFRGHGKLEVGMVLTSSDLSLGSSGWEPSDFAGLNEAFRELSNEGFVIITPSKGLELTEKGLNYLFREI